MPNLLNPGAAPQSRTAERRRASPINFAPGALTPLYGGDSPNGAMGFVRFKLD
jgi:hypothetical protein